MNLTTDTTKESDNFYLNSTFTTFTVINGLIAIVILIVIYTCKELRSQFVYRFIIHWSVITALSHLSFVASLILFPSYLSDNVKAFVGFCLYFSTLLNWVIITAMVVDSLLSSFFVLACLRFRQISDGFFAACYVLAMAFHSYFCYKYYTKYDALTLTRQLVFLLVICYILCLFTFVTVLIINFTKREVNTSASTMKKISLFFCGISLLSFAFIVFPRIINAFYLETTTAIQAIRYSCISVFLVAFLNPTLYFILLLNLDETFRASLMKLVSCNFRTKDSSYSIQENEFLQYNPHDDDLYGSHA